MLYSMQTYKTIDFCDSSRCRFLAACCFEGGVTKSDPISKKVTCAQLQLCLGTCHNAAAMQQLKGRMRWGDWARLNTDGKGTALQGIPK